MLKENIWLGFLRLHDQGEERSVSGGRARNEATSSVDSPVTIAGMLLIQQAPAGHNDTLTTVIIVTWTISKYTGQKHTIITVDQPLYNRGKKQFGQMKNLKGHII